MTETVDTKSVFTPTTVARLTFIERERINRRLVNALMTPGKQLVVFGRSGGGKTTLLENKLHQTYSFHVASKCIKSTTLDQCLLDAFDQIAPFYVESRKLKKGKKISTSLKNSYLSIQASLSSEEATLEKRMLPPQLTPALLARLLGEIEACWVLEDFHKVEKEEKIKLAQLMKLFMDSADIYPSVRVIAIGAVASAREILACDPEMWNRVSEIEVDLMTARELEAIVEAGEKLLNISLAETVKRRIIHYSNGLPSVCHQLCLNLCLEAGVYKTCDETRSFNDAALAEAVQLWVEDATDSLRGAYDRATRTERKRRYDNRRLIVHALARLGKDGATHASIIAEIHKREPSYQASSLTIYLNKMAKSKEAVLLHDPDSNRYSFASPMLHAYVRALDRPAPGGPHPGSHKRKTEVLFLTNFVSELSSLSEEEMEKRGISVVRRTFNDEEGDEFLGLFKKMLYKGK